jgi:hypothetical protein
MEYLKKDATTLQVTQPIGSFRGRERRVPGLVAVILEYDLDSLRTKEAAILQKINDFTVAQERELSEIRELISQCQEMGVQSKVGLGAEEERVG